MGAITYLSDRQFSPDCSLERIVVAAKADPGFWLMVIEREMEIRSHKAQTRRGCQLEAPLRNGLKPSLSDLVGILLTRLFGNCAPDMMAAAEARLIEAAKEELDANALNRVTVIGTDQRS